MGLLDSVTSAFNSGIDKAKEVATSIIGESTINEAVSIFNDLNQKLTDAVTVENPPQIDNAKMEAVRQNIEEAEAPVYNIEVTQGDGNDPETAYLDAAENLQNKPERANIFTVAGAVVDNLLFSKASAEEKKIDEAEKPRLDTKNLTNTRNTKYSSNDGKAIRAEDRGIISKDSKTLSKEEQILQLRHAGYDISKCQENKSEKDGTYSFQFGNQHVRVVKDANNQISIIQTNIGNDGTVQTGIYKVKDNEAAYSEGSNAHGNPYALAKQAHQIADDNAGLFSVAKLNIHLRKNINADNIMAFTDAYNNPDVKQGDSSFIDTVISETGSSASQKKEVLTTYMDTMIEAARKNGVSEDVIAKAKSDFYASMNSELDSYRRINPKEMEKSVDLLRSSIAAKSVNTDGTDISEGEAQKIFIETEQLKQQGAKKAFDDGRKNDGISGKVGDTVMGLFGYNTTESTTAELNKNQNNIKRLKEASEKSETEFRKVYKEIYGFEFDKNNVIASQVAKQNYAMAMNVKSADEILQKSSSYTELTEAMHKSGYNDETINKILQNYTKQTGESNLSEEKKTEVLKQAVQNMKTNAQEYLKTAANGKSAEELANEYQLIEKSTSGTTDLGKDVAQFNQNMILTSEGALTALEIGATAALSAALSATGVGAVAGAAGFARTGMLINRLRGAATALNAAKNGQLLAEGTRMASIGNKALQIGTNAGIAGGATFAVDLADGKSVKEAAKKAVLNAGFMGVGVTSSTLAPKLMEAFGIADKRLATEIAEAIMNSAGNAGILQADGADYTKHQAFMDLAASIIMSRLAHSNSAAKTAKDKNVDNGEYITIGQTENKPVKVELSESPVNSSNEITLSNGTKFELPGEIPKETGILADTQKTPAHPRKVNLQRAKAISQGKSAKGVKKPKTEKEVNQSQQTNEETSKKTTNNESVISEETLTDKYGNNINVKKLSNGMEIHEYRSQEGQFRGFEKRKNGKLVEMEAYFENGNKSQTVKYKNEVAVSEENYHENGKLAEVRHHDDKGNLTSLETFSENGNRQTASKYENGHLVSTETFHEDGSKKSLIKYEKNNEQFVSEKVFFNKDGSKTVEKFENGQKVSKQTVQQTVPKTEEHTVLKPLTDSSSPLHKDAVESLSYCQFPEQKEWAKKILSDENLLNNESFIKNFKGIICYSDTPEKLEIAKKIISKAENGNLLEAAPVTLACLNNPQKMEYINKILSNENLLNNNTFIKYLPGIIKNADSIEQLNIAEKIFTNEGLLKNEKFLKNSFSIIRATNTPQKAEITNRILSDSNLLNNETLLDRASFMINNANTKEQINLVNRVLTDKSLLNDLSSLNHLNFVISETNTPAKLDIANQMLSKPELFKHKEISNPFFLSNIVRNSNTPEQIKLAKRILSDENLCKNETFLNSAGHLLWKSDTPKKAQFFNKILSDEKLFGDKTILDKMKQILDLSDIPDGMADAVFTNKSIINDVINIFNNPDKKKTLNTIFSDQKLAKEFSAEDVNTLIGCLKNGTEYKNYIVNDSSSIQKIHINNKGKISSKSINIEEIGKTESLAYLSNLDKKLFGVISKAKHGARLDSSLIDYKIKVGDKEVELLTDNNIVTQEWAKQNGIPKNGSIMTKETKQTISEALKQMEKMGQKLPLRIYFTDLFAPEPRHNFQKTCGYFSLGDSEAILLKSDIGTYSEDWVKHVVYHESAHMQDAALAPKTSNHYLSDAKGIKINKDDIENGFIELNNKKIKKSDVKKFISEYALTNPLEFVAEISSLITSGKICKTKSGQYTIDTSMSDIMKNIGTGNYTKATGINTVYISRLHKEKLNDIMALYDYLTEGKITTPKII